MNIIIQIWIRISNIILKSKISRSIYYSLEEGKRLFNFSQMSKKKKVY